MRNSVIAWAVAALLAGVPAARAAGADAGEVLAAKGQSFVAVDGQRSPLKVGDPLHVGDVVEVPDGAKLKLRMKDGSVISAAPGSRITIEAYDVDAGGQRKDAKLALASGLLRAVVSTTSQPTRFEVDTATGVAAVRSTDWFIQVQANNVTQVGVVTGVVTLASAATRKEVRIPARWGARVEAGHDPVPPRVWEKSEFEAVIERTNLE